MLLAVLLCSWSASAGRAGAAGNQVEIAADLAAIRACLEMQRKRREKDTCIGRISEMCRDQPSDEIVSARTYFCAARETAAWDQLLNRNFQAQVDAIRGDDVSDQALRDGQLGALRTAQRRWIQFRDAEMIREEKNSQNAMSTWILANVEKVGLEMTARRAIDLSLD
jgi:uncharacterized protein YecT (DUF1311 family)